MKDAEEILADHSAGRIELLVADKEVMVVEAIRFCHGCDLGDVLAEGSGQGEADQLIGADAVMAGGVHFHLVDLLVARQEAVISVFIDDPEADQKGYGHAGAEADDIEATIDFIVDEATPGGGEETL